ncbi:MAG: hypothetical protein HGN29_17940 [Asgard group archaeon]|nr:hypothetical protein [Asgard group archaeon]
MLLHWSTDPLLLDEQPIKYNDWQTANSIIQKEGLKAVLTKDLVFKNLYGIMVRKIDFVRTKSSDRIIARFPFIVINTDVKDQIQDDILLVSEKVRDYFYKSINKSIMQWNTIILNYLEKGSLPYPIFRCCFELKPNLHALINDTSLRFTSARGEAFTFPIKLTNKLAYLCGICNGDGNLRDYWVIIADENKPHIEYLTIQLTVLFGKKGKIMKTGGAWIVKLNLLWVTRLFNFLTDQSIDEPKYSSLLEPLMFQQLKDDTFRKAYWRGVMDSDGSYSKYNICLTTASKQFMNSFTDFLDNYNILYSTRETFFEEMAAYGYKITILAASHIDFCLLIDSFHLKKKIQLDTILKRKITQKEKGQIIKLREESLTSSGFYNFDLIDDLRIMLNPQLATKLYVNVNESLLKQKQPTHNRYKNGKLAIPLSLIKELLAINNKSDITNFLQQNEINTFYSGKSSARLPLKPNDILYEVLPDLKLRKGYIVIDLLKDKNNDSLFNSIKIKLRNLFSISITNTEIWNKVILKFLKTFYEINDY